MTAPFTLDLGWATLLQRLGLEPGALLRAARLPPDLFGRPRPQLEPEALSRLWAVLEERFGAEALPLTVGQEITAEVMSPPLFAAYCSPDLATALGRLARFKPLIGPLLLGTERTPAGLVVSHGAPPGIQVPQGFLVTELVFLVDLARRATGRRIVPRAVELAALPRDPGYRAFFGVTPRLAQRNRLVFAAEDATRPFRSANDRLFAAFEPDLRQRLDDLDAGRSLAERLRACLMEALPAGQAEVGTVARRLGMSPRSLQRRLAADGTGFQAELAALRARLARGYLSGTTHSLAEIAFLLGYDDPSAFFRAFRGWTGTTPQALRSAAAPPPPPAGWEAAPGNGHGDGAAPNLPRD